MPGEGAKSASDREMHDVRALGEITPEVLRNTFPAWRVFDGSGAWWATRCGVQEWTGPESLLRRVLCAPDLTALAEKLCLQEWLDGLGADELAAVYRDMSLPETSG
jgi:hypothetical protein